jgi:hypothetical protein
MAIASSSTQVDRDRAYNETAKLHEEGNLAEAWTGYEQLVDSPWWGGQARYGLSLICLRAGSCDSALLDNVDRLALFVVWPGLLALLYVRARTTIFTIANGRLQVESGIFLRKQDAYELWTVGALGLRRSVFNYITGDGTLVFHLRYGRQTRQGLFGALRRAAMRSLGDGTDDLLLVRGLAKARELKVIYNRLESLRLLLRVNNYIKGIISG